MILPIGHEHTSVRRLPWVTFAIMGFCALAFLGSLGGTGDYVEEMARRLQRVDEYFSEHPYLDLDQRFYGDADDEQIAALREVQRQLGPPPPKDPAQRRVEQDELDRLTEEAFSAARDTPYHRWGLIPAQPTVHGFVTYQFMHGGWMHLLGNLLFLYLVGPFIEDVWGRPLFLGFYLVAGVMAALGHILNQPGSQTVLIGASGSIAGVMGAFLIRYARTKIRFLYWFFFFRPGTFSAPAWLMLPLWFGREVFFAQATDLAGVSSGTAHWAHVWGFASGILVGVLVAYLKIEQRFLHPSIEAKITAVDNTVVEHALDAAGQGRHQEALSMLSDALASDPDNIDVGVAYWNLAVDTGRAADAAPQLVRFLERAARRGDSELVAVHWPEAVRALPELRADPVLVVRLTELLASTSDGEAVRDSLEVAARSLTPTTPVGALVRLTRIADSCSSATAGTFAVRALEHPELPAEARKEIEQIARLAGPIHETAAAEARPAAEDREVLIDAVEPVQPAAPSLPPRLQVMEAVPEAISSDALTIATGNRRRRLPLSQVMAVAVGGIAQANQQPFVVVDLLIDPPGGSDGRLRVVRLRGNRFDPRRIVGGSEVMGALRELLERMIELSEATTLPDPEAARGRPFRRFSSLANFEREVLGASGRA